MGLGNPWKGVERRLSWKGFKDGLGLQLVVAVPGATSKKHDEGPLTCTLNGVLVHQRAVRLSVPHHHTLEFQLPAGGFGGLSREPAVVNITEASDGSLNGVASLGNVTIPRAEFDSGKGMVKAVSLTWEFVYKRFSYVLVLALTDKNQDLKITLNGVLISAARLGKGSATAKSGHSLEIGLTKPAELGDIVGHSLEVSFKLIPELGDFFFDVTGRMGIDGHAVRVPGKVHQEMMPKVLPLLQPVAAPTEGGPFMMPQAVVDRHGLAPPAPLAHVPPPQPLANPPVHPPAAPQPRTTPAAAAAAAPPPAPQQAAALPSVAAPAVATAFVAGTAAGSAAYWVPSYKLQAVPTPAVPVPQAPLPAPIPALPTAAAHSPGGSWVPFYAAQSSRDEPANIAPVDSGGAGGGKYPTIHHAHAEPASAPPMPKIVYPHSVAASSESSFLAAATPTAAAAKSWSSQGDGSFSATTTPRATAAPMSGGWSTQGDGSFSAPSASLPHTSVPPVGAGSLAHQLSLASSAAASGPSYTTEAHSMNAQVMNSFAHPPEAANEVAHGLHLPPSPTHSATSIGTYMSAATAEQMKEDMKREMLQAQQAIAAEMQAAMAAQMAALQQQLADMQAQNRSLMQQQFTTREQEHKAQLEAEVRSREAQHEFQMASTEAAWQAQLERSRVEADVQLEQGLHTLHINSRHQLQENLCCPITHCVMEDPVMASDGFTYERAAISAWLRQQHSSPMTNKPLTSLALVPNHQARSMIQELALREEDSTPKALPRNPAKSSSSASAA